MKYFGIDVGKEKHSVAGVSEAGELLLKPRFFEENAEGYEQLRGWLGEPVEVMVGLEATGHYWKNLVAMLVARGYSIVLINPLRTKRYAEEEMLRAKTDEIDAKAIARYLAEKKPSASRLPDALTASLRELVHLRDRLVQDLGDRARQLHRALDLVFPELVTVLKDPASARATTILRAYPTARALAKARLDELAKLKYDGRHAIGRELAEAIVELAGRSVGAHDGGAYALQVQYFCEDIEAFRSRIADLSDRIERTLDDHQVAKLLTSIDGIGSNTAARIVATLGNPAEFDSAKALAAFVGVAPGTSQSGRRRPVRSSLSKLGAADLRRMLWMPTLRAIQNNPVIAPYYERLVLRGKPRKVAIIASMRKLLELVYAIAKRGTAFEVRAA